MIVADRKLIQVLPEDIKDGHFDVPEGVTEIEEGAFEDCINLKKVTIPEGVMKIEAFAFWNCERLKEVTLPVGLKEIGENAFSHCERLESIAIPDSVMHIGEYAFNKHTCLTVKEAEEHPLLMNITLDGFEQRYLKLNNLSLDGLTSWERALVYNNLQFLKYLDDDFGLSEILTDFTEPTYLIAHTVKQKILGQIKDSVITDTIKYVKRIKTTQEVK